MLQRLKSQPCFEVLLREFDAGLRRGRVIQPRRRANTDKVLKMFVWWVRRQLCQPSAKLILPFQMKLYCNYLHMLKSYARNRTSTAQSKSKLKNKERLLFKKFKKEKFELRSRTHTARVSSNEARERFSQWPDLKEVFRREKSVRADEL